MGWPRKNESMRLYCEPGGSFLVVFVGQDRNPDGSRECLANAMSGAAPSLCMTSVSDAYLSRGNVRRYQWDDLPDGWRDALARRLAPDGMAFNPALHPGLWRVGARPEVSPFYGLTLRG